MRLRYSWLTKEMLSTVRDTSSYVVPVFCLLEVEKIVVLLNDKGNVLQLLDNSSYVVSLFCFLDVEEVVVSLTDRGNVLQRS